MNYVVITQPPSNCMWADGYNYIVNDVVKYELEGDWWVFLKMNGIKSTFRKDVVISITPEYLEVTNNERN